MTIKDEKTYNEIEERMEALGQFLVRGGTVLPLCGFQRGEIHPCRADSRLYRPD